jgi:SnoaL-like domain
MNQDNIAIAEAYYRAMGEKNITGMSKYLHPDVQFMGPLAEMRGKEAVLEAANHFVSLFNTLTISAKFGSKDQAMLALDLDFPAPIGNFPAAVLITIQEGLISEIRLYYDARPLERQRNEIFSQ